MPRRFKEARLMRKMKMVDAAVMLGVSQPTLSAWETERKSPNPDNLVALADLYKVTVDYLLGRDTMDGSLPDTVIPRQCIPFYHGKPVWSEYYGWGIVNAADQLLLFVDKQLPLADIGTVYRFSAPYSESDLPAEGPLDLTEIGLRQKIWVEPISEDRQLREELRGWYTVRDRYVENEFGQRFYMDTYGAKWLGFRSQTE